MVIDISAQSEARQDDRLTHVDHIIKTTNQKPRKPTSRSAISLSFLHVSALSLFLQPTAERVRETNSKNIQKAPHYLPRCCHEATSDRCTNFSFALNCPRGPCYCRGCCAVGLGWHAQRREISIFDHSLKINATCSGTI
jgi:hypothetical protein